MERSRYQFGARTLRLPLTKGKRSRLPSVIAAALFALLPLVVWANHHVTVVELFTPPDLPEGVAVDNRGNVYVSMLPTGEIKKMSPNGQWSTVARLNPGRDGLLVALTLSASGDIYVPLAANVEDPAADTKGVWRIRPDGATQLVAALPQSGLPNQLAFAKTGDLYVSDSALGVIWRISRAGQVSKWLDHPLLRGNEQACPDIALPLSVGVNGLAFGPGGDLYAANTDTGNIVRIPIHPKTGQPGTPTVAAGGCAWKGADGIAFDVQDNLYAALNGQNRLVRMSWMGDVETLATAADGLDFPTNIAFGTTRGDQTSLYLVNLAFPSVAAGNAKPSLLRLDVGIPGRPLP